MQPIALESAKASLDRATVIFGLGSSTRKPEEFMALLSHYGIEALVDIRRFPTSSRYPHFTRENLAALVESHGMRYHYLGSELGGYGTCRACGTYRVYHAAPCGIEPAVTRPTFRCPNSPAAWSDWRSWCDGTYRCTMRHRVSLPSCVPSGGTWHAYHMPWPWRCHRRFVAQALYERGWRVRHVIDMDQECPPKAGRKWRSEQPALGGLTQEEDPCRPVSSA